MFGILYYLLLQLFAITVYAHVSILCFAKIGYLMLGMLGYQYPASSIKTLFLDMSDSLLRFCEKSILQKNATNPLKCNTIGNKSK
jgi:hypothetical protein